MDPQPVIAHTLTIDGERVRMPDHPVFRPDREAVAGAELLLAGLRELGTGTACLLDMAADPAVPVLARRLRLTLRDEHLMALRHAEAMLAASAPDAAVDARLVDLSAPAPPERHEAICLNLRYLPGKDALRDALRWAAAWLDSAGRLLLVGANRRGVRSAAGLLGDRFARVEVAGLGAGQRLLVAAGPRPGGDGDPAPADAPAEVVTVTLRGLRLDLERAPALFADGLPDEGAALLAEALPVPRPGARVLDLGCGGGVLALVLAGLQPAARVTALDEYARAVAVARRNFARNGLAQVRVVAGDGFDALAGERFDLIACNPPFHFGGIQTPDLARAWLRAAPAYLAPGGELWVVANRFLPYEATLRGAFGRAEVVRQTGRFKLLRAVVEG